MLLKVSVVLLIAVAAATAAPVSEHDDEDIPVYTEKVVPSSPTKAPPKTSSPAPPVPPKRLNPKRSHASPKAQPSPLFTAHENDGINDKRVSKVVPEKYSYKPLPKKRTRDIKRIGGPKHSLRGEYAVSNPVYTAVPKPSSHVPGPPPQVIYDDVPAAYDVDEPEIPYAPREPLSYGAPLVPSHVDSRPHAPKYSAPATGPHIGYAAAPVQRYVPAPQPARQSYKPEYVDDEYDSDPQPYSFGYELKDADGATQTRQEVDDGYGNKKGSYGYTDGYGIYRRVEYIADKNGFRATIKTNEPGTSNDDPADVEIHSDASEQSLGY